LTDALHLAVLGDVHGHLTLAFRVLRRWERETGHQLDLALQVGDLGAYPPPFRLDRATKRFSEKDPDELGFADYYEGGPDAEDVFGDEATDARRFDANLVFIKGNHEDFEFLAEVAGGEREPVPVDAFGRVRYLPSGSRWTFSRRGISLTIGALGGIADEDGGPGSSAVSPFYTAAEVRHLRGDGARLDVFLSHEPPFGAAGLIHPKYADSGSPEVHAFLREVGARYHFCGHYHEPGTQLGAPDDTHSYVRLSTTYQQRIADAGLTCAV
jgi:Calcineurin-like phosphoesterase